MTKMKRATARRRLFGVTGSEMLSSAVPAVVLLVLGLWLALRFVDPAPPKHLTMLVGREDQAYLSYAHHYMDALAEDGIELRLVTSAGSMQSLARLRDRGNDVDLALLQDGLHDGKDIDLLSLGSVQYQPIWFFTRGRNQHARLADLEGGTVAIGETGSGTQVFARRLLEANRFDMDKSDLLPLNAE